MKRQPIHILRLRKMSEELGANWEIRLSFRDGLRVYGIYYRAALRFETDQPGLFLKKMRQIITQKRYNDKRNGKEFEG